MGGELSAGFGNKLSDELDGELCVVFVTRINNKLAYHLKYCLCIFIFTTDPCLMVLEYASKGTMQTFLRRNRPGVFGAKPPPPDIMLRFAVHAAKGMSFLQSQQVRFKYNASVFHSYGTICIS